MFEAVELKGPQLRTPYTVHCTYFLGPQQKLMGTWGNSHTLPLCALLNDFILSRILTYCVNFKKKTLKMVASSSQVRKSGHMWRTSVLKVVDMMYLFFWLICILKVIFILSFTLKILN